MKPDEGWPIRLLKMAAHGILDHRLQFLERLGFGEDGMTERFGFEAAFRGIFYEKDDLSVHRPDLLVVFCFHSTPTTRLCRASLRCHISSAGITGVDRKS